MIKNLDAIQNIFLSRFKNLSGKSATHLIDYTATPNWHETSFNAFVLTYTCNGSPSKNPDIKTPIVVSILLEVFIPFSPLAACWCQGSSKECQNIKAIFSTGMRNASLIAMIHFKAQFKFSSLQLLSTTIIWNVKYHLLNQCTLP